jgi:hypothetical protein
VIDDLYFDVDSFPGGRLHLYVQYPLLVIGHVTPRVRLDDGHVRVVLGGQSEGGFQKFREDRGISRASPNSTLKTASLRGERKGLVMPVTIERRGAYHGK